ncbi:MAG: class I SAM-dependent methyltransferase [Candidatus Binatia bacterium]
MTASGAPGASRLERLAEENGFGVRRADGSTFGAASAAFVVTLHSDRLPRVMAAGASPLRLGEAWIASDFDLEGDIFAAMETLHSLEAASPPAWLRVLGAMRRLLRPWRDAGRDISSHYDLPSAFFETFLDTRLVYTCAYYRHADAGLEQAQQDKLDLVCRKLRLAPGQSFLDLGCGWGALACWAAANYGVRAHGVTLSREQADWAVAAVGRAGLGDRVTIEHGDYRHLPPGRRYDRIAAVGMIEHLGRAGHATLFGTVRSLLPGDGLFLNHGITMRGGASWSSEMEFLHRYVFPGLDLVDAATTLQAMEAEGLEVLDVENLRPHYARTTKDWATRLWARRAEASAIAGDRAWRTWVAYLAAASIAFRNGWIGLHQVVARPAGLRDDGVDPQLRDRIYAGAVTSVSGTSTTSARSPLRPAARAR